MKDKRIGIAVTGSFCTFAKLLPVMRQLVEKGNTLVPVFSYAVSETDTRFYQAKDFFADVRAICGTEPIQEISKAEPIGPKNDLDVLAIVPCTGNTLAKLNGGITDTPVLMAAKAHIRNNKPLVIAVSTNDALAANFKNIGELMNKKNIYFVPFGQDDPVKKNSSLVADFSLTEATCASAIQGKQLQPVIL